jgi:predicted anti-sigma-YlaC factor YlaD
MCGSLIRLSRNLQTRAGRGRAHKHSVSNCAQIRHELGAYLVGAISPRDRAVLVGHLATCDQCRDELAGLAALPGLLRRAPEPQ